MRHPSSRRRAVAVRDRRTSRTPGRPTRSVARPGILAAVLLVGLALPSASATAAQPTAGAGGNANERFAASAGATPDGSIEYQEAIAHEGDHLTFAAGGRVDVAFSPRDADRWRVGGVTPTRLPAGRLDGVTIRAQSSRGQTKDRQGPTPDRSIDLPTAGPPRPLRRRHGPPRGPTPSRRTPRSGRASSAGRCSASCRTGRSARAVFDSTRRSSRRSPTSAWAQTRRATSRRRTATDRRRSAGAAGRRRP